MKKFYDSRLFIRIISLLLAILLFVYVDQAKLGSTRSQTMSNDNIALSANKTADVSVPLQLNVNTDKYFVTGYPEKVKVHLTGPQALVTTTANTQNFKVYASLNGLSVGKHTVTLQQEGLNREIKYRLSPAKIDVNIQPRREVTFPVKIRYDSKNVASGYKAGKATSDVSSVKATGAANEIDKIKEAVAQLDVSNGAKATVNKQAVIEALDKNGKTVNVILTPSTTRVNLPITPVGDTKKVDVSLKAKDGADDKDYKLTTETKTVTAFGSKSALKSLTSAEVDVDVSAIKKSTTKEIALSPKLNGIDAFDPTSVKVRIEVSSK